jgi:pimeloyl-ACP methyl ester carboxylesterase
MNHDNRNIIARRIAAAIGTALVTFGAPIVSQAADKPPLNLARDGFFYAGGEPTKVNGKTYIAGQMYVEFRIPAKQTHPYPIVFIHGGTRSGANWTGTVDGREGWAQYFTRRGYATYVVDQPGRGRSAYVEAVYGKPRFADAESAQRRYMQQEKFKLWPQAHLHTQWPGSGEIDDPATRQIIGSFLPEIPFSKSPPITNKAMLALADKIGPFIVLGHSQGGPIAWAIADARPDLVKAVVAVEPNGPPGHSVRFKGAPDWFEDGPLALPFGVTATPIAYAPAADASGLKWVKEDKPDAPDLVTCWKQAEPARQLVNLKKMPVVVVTSEASYHASYDHCTVKFLKHAGVNPTWLKLADLGIKGNSHNLMQEKNSDEIAAVIYQWLDNAVPAKE